MKYRNENGFNLHMYIFILSCDNVVVTPCYVTDSTSAYGTSSSVKVYFTDGVTVTKEYVVIVYGDGAVDALDAQTVSVHSNGSACIETRFYRMAADMNSSDDITVDDYQALVNKVVA